jgi:uncharacterized protein
MVALQYAPAYNIAINGDDLPAAVRTCITSVRYEEGLDGADQVQITLANPDLQFLQDHIRGLSPISVPLAINVNTIRRFGVLPSGLFDIDNKVRLSLGYSPDPLDALFLGEITGVGASFPSTGMPTLTITAHDFLQRLTRGTYTRGFGPLPDAAVIAILSVENGLIPLIEPSIIPLDVLNTIGNFLFGTSRKQYHQSDFQLLKSVAERYDMEISVSGHALLVTRFIKEYTPRLTLAYGQSLMDFSPRFSSAGRAVGVTMRVSLREIRIDLIINVFWDFDRESIGITIIPAQASTVVKSRSASDQSKHKTIRNAIDIANTVVGMIHELRQKLNNRLTGVGSAVGDPRLRAGAIIQLEGLGVDFSGRYRVTKAVHTIDTNGYRTNFDVQREIIP